MGFIKGVNRCVAMDGIEIISSISTLNIRNFKGIINVKSSFPTVVQDRECGIINKGGHWVCYLRDGDKKYYFDSFNKKSPLKLVRYLGNNVVYNKIRVQNYDENICGELCIKVLKLLSDGNTISKTLNLIK